MKIVHIAPGVYPIPSRDKATAIEEIIFQLANHLIKLGCKVFIIDIKAEPSQREGALAKFKEVKTFSSHRRVKRCLFSFQAGFFAFTHLPVLWRLLGIEKMDIIHTHYSYSAVTAMMISRLRQRIPVVHTTHAHDLIMNPCLKNYLKGIPEIIALKMADGIIAETPAVKRRLISDFSIDRAKISVIYSGVEQEEIEQFVYAKQGSLHSPNTIVLCVGRISKRKNQLSVVKAIPKVLARHRDVKFVFVGPFEELDYLRLMQTFINEKHLSPWVEFTGEVPKQKLFEFYNNATIFVFPTLAEIQGLVLIEAMAFGLPVIASNIEPIEDIANLKKQSIITINPNDPSALAEAIILLLKNPLLRKSMSINAKEIASTLSWEHIAERTLDLYEKIVKNNNQKL